MTPRGARQQVADLATEHRDRAHRRIRNLRAEILQLESEAAMWDTVTKVVGVRTEPLRELNDTIPPVIEIPEFERTA